VASDDLYEQQQNYPSRAPNYRPGTCQQNRDPALSVDPRFDGHECFRHQKPDHHTGSGGGYLQEVRLYFGRYLIMSELQDKLDRCEIILDQYHASWIAQMEENERLHPGIHDRLFEYLMAKYPGPGCRGAAFLGLEELRENPPNSQQAGDRPQIRRCG
jgi:hypothetical protein